MRYSTYFVRTYLCNFVWRQIGVCVFWALTSVGALFIFDGIDVDFQLIVTETTKIREEFWTCVKNR